MVPNFHLLVHPSKAIKYFLSRDKVGDPAFLAPHHGAWTLVGWLEHWACPPCGAEETSLERLFHWVHQFFSLVSMHHSHTMEPAIFSWHPRSSSSPPGDNLLPVTAIITSSDSSSTYWITSILACFGADCPSAILGNGCLQLYGPRGDPYAPSMLHLPVIPEDVPFSPIPLLLTLQNLLDIHNKVGFGPQWRCRAYESWRTAVKLKKMPLWGTSHRRSGSSPWSCWPCKLYRRTFWCPTQTSSTTTRSTSGDCKPQERDCGERGEPYTEVTPTREKRHLEEAVRGCLREGANWGLDCRS